MSVSWLVGWLAVGGGWAVRVVESAESSGAVCSAAVDARALGLQEDVSESRSSTETGDGRWKDVSCHGWGGDLGTGRGGWMLRERRRM